MSAIVEVKYFNSFVLKKVLSPESTPGANDETPVWNGSFGIPPTLGGYPGTAETSDSNITDKNWAIEESRIRGGYNNTSVSFGPKAYLVEEEPDATFRTNSLIYSGIFNSSTGINETNVFSVGTDITRSLNPAYGSIQKIYALHGFKLIDVIPQKTILCQKRTRHPCTNKNHTMRTQP